ncbi:unnamed protein product [Amoebophrya sp. A120]|nr:unnamed protein product [Amoebophrya sp. A120]|eukprot:GSA120T00022642001.1
MSSFFGGNKDQISPGGGPGMEDPTPRTETPGSNSTNYNTNKKQVDPVMEQGKLRSVSQSGDSFLKKMTDDEAPIRALPPVDLSRFDFLNMDGENQSMLPPAKLELGLGLFRKLFQTLSDRFSIHPSNADEIHIQHFERAMRRVLKVIGDEDTVFRSEHYDVDGSGAVGWWEFVAVWKNSSFFIQLTTMERVFMVFEDPSSCRLAKWLSFFLLATIMFSSILFIVATLPEFKVWPNTACETTCNVDTVHRQAWPLATFEYCRDDCIPKQLPVFDQMEVVCVIIFSAEYIARLLTCHGCRPEVLSEDYLLKLCLGEHSLGRRHGRLRRLSDFILTPMNLVDVLAIVPFYLELFVGSSGVQGSTVLRVVRLTRLFRFMKVAKYVNTITVIAKVFTRSFLALAVLLFVLLLFVTVSASIIYFAESGHWDPVKKTWVRRNWVIDDVEATPFKSIPHSMWWSFVTYTTVGYGDMAPYSLVGQLAGIISMLTALLVVAMPTSVLLNNFTDVWTEHHADLAVQSKQNQIERETVENVMQFEEPEALLRRIQIEVYDENVLGEFLFLGEVLLEFDLIGKNWDAIEKAEKEGLRSLRARARNRDGSEQSYDTSGRSTQANVRDSKKLKLAPVEFDINHFHGKIEAPLQNNIMKVVKSGMEKQLNAQGSIEVELKWTPFNQQETGLPAIKHGGHTFHPGNLTVKIIRARYLYPAHESDEFLGEMIASPHANVSVWPKVPSSGDIKLEHINERTKTMHDDVNPVWNEEVSFDFFWKSQEDIEKEEAKKLKRSSSMLPGSPVLGAESFAPPAKGGAASAAAALPLGAPVGTPSGQRTSGLRKQGTSESGDLQLVPVMGGSQIPPGTPLMGNMMGGSNMTISLDEEQMAQVMRQVLHEQQGNSNAELLESLRAELQNTRKEMKRIASSGGIGGGGAAGALDASLPNPLYGGSGTAAADMGTIERELQETRKQLSELMMTVNKKIIPGLVSNSAPSRMHNQQHHLHGASQHQHAHSGGDMNDPFDDHDLYPSNRSPSASRNRGNTLALAGRNSLDSRGQNNSTIEYDIIRIREDVRDVRRGVAELLELTRGGNVIVLPGGGPRRGVFQNHMLD